MASELFSKEGQMVMNNQAAHGSPRIASGVRKRIRKWWGEKLQKASMKAEGVLEPSMRDRILESIQSTSG